MCACGGVARMGYSSPDPNISSATSLSVKAHRAPRFCPRPTHQATRTELIAAKTQLQALEVQAAAAGKGTDSASSRLREVRTRV